MRLQAWCCTALVAGQCGPWPRRTLCGWWVCRAGSRRRPCRADRRGSANSSGSVRRPPPRAPESVAVACPSRADQGPAPPAPRSNDGIRTRVSGFQSARGSRPQDRWCFCGHGPCLHVRRTVGRSVSVTVGTPDPDKSYRTKTYPLVSWSRCTYPARLKAACRGGRVQVGEREVV